MSPRGRPITSYVLAGADGSTESLAAVELAAREAALRHQPLHVVHASVWPLMNVPLEAPPGVPDGGLRHHAELVVQEATAHARTVAPGLRVSGEVATGGAAAVLLSRAASASLVVVGDRGLGGFTGLLIGSVAVQLASHAPCPVLVLRGAPALDGPVVLGADGSPASDPAVGSAFEAASLRCAPLTALHAWKHPAPTGPDAMAPLVHDPVAVQAAEERLLAEALAGWHRKYPGIVVRRRLVRGGPRSALIDATRDAQLIVVGARGRGELTGLLLGSVSQAVLHHAACPVMIVPHARPGSAARDARGIRRS